MHILKKLTIKDLKLNKKRTAGTLIGIILSTALITVVGGMFFIFQNTLVQTSINQNGYYHIQLSDISQEQVETVKNNNNFSHVETAYDLGWAMGTNQNNHEFFERIYSMTNETADYLKYTVSEGRFPQNENEVLISTYIMKNSNIKIGDKIQCIVGEIEEGEEVSIKNGENYEFIVVGITEKYQDTIITTGIQNEKIDVYLTLQNPMNHKEDIGQLLEINGDYSQEKSKIYEDYYINNSLLRWEVFSFSDQTLSILFGIVTVIITIILVTSVFSIRNSFAISTTEKTRTYGMLSSIGATKKQIKHMVLFEGMSLGAIGLPTGALFGVFVTWILTIIINAIANGGNIMTDGWLLYYKFSIIPIVIALLVGMIMIYLSTTTCAKKASKVSPIQNIRNADDLKSKKIKLKTPGVIKAIFKIGGVLSYKNLKRSRKKYRVTVISLTVSILVFIIVSSVVSYGNMVIGENYSEAIYNVNVTDYMQNSDVFKDEQKMAELENFEKAYVLYSQDFSNTDYTTKGYYELMDLSHILYDNVVREFAIKYDENYIPTEYANYASVIMLIYNETYMRDFAKEINKDYDYIKDKVVIVNKTKDMNISDRNVYVDITDYKVGDDFTLTETITKGNLNYKVGAVVEQYPKLAQFNGEEEALIIVLSSEYCNLDIIPRNVYYDSENPDKLVETIEEEFPTLQVYNLDREAKAINSMVLIFSIFVYGFIIVVTLIGVTSVFNTITSNMELRKKEFAMLKSIGMTKREFNNMIYLESLFYSFKSLFIGVIIGIAGSYLVYKIFAEKWDYGYIFPSVPIGISFVFVLAVVAIIMRYSIGKINKQNIIETIRKDNI